MSVLHALEMVLTAAALSIIAAALLKLLPSAPPRVRLRIALAGVAAWFVPWPLIGIPVEPSVAAAIAIEDWARPLAELAARDASVSGTEQGSGAPAPAWPFQVGLLIVLLAVPGAIRFVLDSLALRATVRRWRRISVCGNALRASLPPELQSVRASIRIVPGTRVAAASGWLAPTVWLGDRLEQRDREIALVHELWHVRGRDPLWITILTAARRLHWWNPAVLWLCREAALMIESECDRRCADCIGPRVYVERLASLMLGAGGRAMPSLAAHARTPSLNVARLKLLGRPTRFGFRERALIGLFALAGLATAAYGMVEPRGARPAWSQVTLPLTPAGRALADVLDAYNAGDAERLTRQLGAFTPQEVHLRLPAGIGDLEVLRIVSSSPRRIEYIVRGSSDPTMRLGELEVGTAPEFQIMRVGIIDAEGAVR